MKSGTTYFLLILVALVGVFIWFFERGSDTTAERGEKSRLAVRIKPEQITSLHIQSGELDVACRRTGDEWLLTEPVRGRADSGEIDRIIADLEQLERVDTITGKQQKRREMGLDAFGLAEPRASITFGNDTTQRTLLIGREAPTGHTVYVKDSGREEIIVTGERVLKLAPATIDTLRERELFGGDAYDVERVEVRRSEGFLQVVQTDAGVWRIQQPLPARADERAIRRLLDGLFELLIEEFVTDSLADPAAYGLDEGAVRIVLRTRAGDEQTLLLGNPLEEKPEFVYARLEDFDSVYAVKAEVLEQLSVKPNDLRDRQLVFLAPHEVSVVRIQDEEQTLELKKDDGGAWTIATPVQWRADQERVADLLTAWAGARIEAFRDGVGTNLQENGLAPPLRTLSLTASRPAALADADGVTPDPMSEEVNVKVCSVPEGDRVVAWVEGDDSLYEISSSLLDSLSPDPLSYRDRTVLRVPASAIRKITVARSGLEQTVEMDEAGVFRASVPEAGDVDLDAVDDILNVVNPLRASRFIAEDPSDLALYGLENPATVLTLGLTGESGIEKSVLLGMETDGDGVYAMVRGEDVVSVVSKALPALLRRELYVPAPSSDE